MSKYIFLMFIAVIISSFSQILLKKSTKKQYSNFIFEYLNPYVLSGYAMLLLSTVVVLLAYRGMEFKYGPIIESLGYILVMVLSYLFFKEKISKKKTLGYALILIGVIIFNI